ncbi:hypothetical protein SDJN02_21342, partial [Cucurbita argyrosperma subsp. argyrosperma]
MARKFGGGLRPTGTPSVGWSFVVVVSSLLAGASIVHNIYKPNLTLPPVDSVQATSKKDHDFVRLLDCKVQVNPGSYQAGNRCKGSRQTLGLADPLKKQIKPKSLQAPQMTSLDDFPALPAIFSIHIVTILSLFKVSQRNGDQSKPSRA